MQMHLAHSIRGFCRVCIVARGVMVDVDENDRIVKIHGDAATWIIR